MNFEGHEAIPKNANEQGYDLQRISREKLPKIEHDFLHIDGQDKELLQAWFDYLQDILDDPDSYLDHGGAAVVFTVNETICIKMIINRHDTDNASMFNLGNTAEAEMRFQESMSSIEVAGVRCPKPILYLHGKKHHGIIMEKVDAVNLQKCINKEQEFPELFNAEEFCFDLEEYIYEMNDTHNLAHGDLYPRNVMIDKKTGKPIVIDFGRAQSKNEILKRDDKTKLKELFKLFNVKS